MSGLDLFSGMVQGFAQTKERQKQQDELKKERDARVKLFEIQLEREQRENKTAQQQQEFKSQLINKMTTGAPDPANPGATGKPPSLTELLADPQNLPMLLGSGMTDIKTLAADQDKASMMGMLRQALGGAQPGQQPGQSQGGQPAPQSPQGQTPWEVGGIKFDTHGNPMFDLQRPEVKTWITSPDGRTKQGVDARGRVITTMPGAPSDRAPEDVPLPPSQLLEFTDGQGNHPPPGTTLKDAQAKGFKSSSASSVTPETAGRISGLLQAKEIAQQIKTKFIKPDGSIDKGLVMTSWGNVPKTKGREIRNDLGIAVDAVLRARSGAGVNNTEMTQIVQQFIPNPMDGDEGVISKFHRLDQFVNGALDIVTLPQSVKDRIQKFEQGKGKQESKVIDFNDLPK